MTNINRVFLIILGVLFALGMASFFFSIRHLYDEDKPSPSVSEPPVGTIELPEPPPKKLAPMKDKPQQVDEVDMPSPSSEKTELPKLVPEKFSPAAPPEASDVSTFQLKNVLELEKKRAAIINVIENSKPPETVPSIPDNRKTWADVGDQVMELEQQRENSINSLSTPAANQQEGK